MSYYKIFLPSEVKHLHCRNISRVVESFRYRHESEKLFIIVIGFPVPELRLGIRDGRCRSYRIFRYGEGVDDRLK